jgi:cellulose synthase/poly-beta-1,6-N-acetylglucosamine synthase-like glycosyltransferase
MQHWYAILMRVGYPLDKMAAIAARAQTNATSFHAELLAAAPCPEANLYFALAEELGLPFRLEIDSGGLVTDNHDFIALLGPGGAQRPLSYLDGSGPLVRLLGLGLLDIGRLKALLQRRPELCERLVVVPPAALRRAVKERAAATLGAQARDQLANDVPDCSARLVASAWQGLVVGALAMALPIAFALWPFATMFGVHLFLSVFFLGCVLLRMRAARHAQPPYLKKLAPVAAKDLPTYSVMVALYREADVVPELLAGLGRIVWPRSKLEIKLVCEADDHETLAALRAVPLKPWVEIIEVPAIGPRTKPKALAYALPTTTGQVVAIYDAEDKPHPLQLVEAWQAFAKADASLACVQAPLVITNSHQGMLARLFAFEYAALFRGLLPWLAARSLILPLGGTSNHFRREALVNSGGWDPFNVTEDADLGLRLARFGYRSGTITYPTFEDAPMRIKTWIPQRTRWFKGWLQTWLVHMRRPMRLWRELGTGSFLMVQILFAGMVLSAAAHPLMLLTLAGVVTELAWGSTPDAQRSIIFAVDAVNITCGYAAFLVLGAATLMKRERKGFWRVVLATPLYWMLISFAAWRAVWHLYRKPFVWEKTPHRRSASVWAREARAHKT